MSGVEPPPEPLPPGPPSDELTLSFGSFSLHPGQGILTFGRAIVPLGARAFAILLALVECAGEVVSYDDLVERAWPTTRVDAVNLRVQISGARKALVRHGASEQLIVNVPGRGYQFGAKVARSFSRQVLASAPQTTPGNLPVSAGEVLGRDQEIADIHRMMAHGPLVTIVGPGGIGKTTLAVVAARGAEASAVWFVDLASVVDPALIPVALARALDLEVKSDRALAEVQRVLATVPSLVILDNCEHLIAATSELAGVLLSGVHGLKVLATSREPLHLKGEQILRLEGLKTPGWKAAGVADVLLYPAAQLFVERARAHTGSFDISEKDAALIAKVCRRLDGSPLALELAAGAVGSIGLQALARRLEAHSAYPQLGTRTARPRQKSLKATLDWSFDLLDEDEKQLLARLGVFSSRFTLASAIAVCADPGADEREVTGNLAQLADKSLVSVDIGHDPVTYRLLEMTRAYAQDKLRDISGYEAVRGRHAMHLAALFHEAQARWNAQDAGGWAEPVRHWIGDLREALVWSVGPTGDLRTGVELLLDSSQLWHDLGLISEFLAFAAAVDLDRLHDARLGMRLSTMIGHAIYEMGCPPDRAAEMHAAFAAALGRAVELGDRQCEFETLVSMCQACAATGDYAMIDPIAARVLVVGRSLNRPDAELYHARIMSSSRQLLGDLPVARVHLNAAYRDPIIRLPLTGDNGFVFDPLLFNKCVDARVRWLQGFADQAMEILADVTTGALALGHVPTYGYVLRTVIPVAVWAGDAAFIEGPLETFLRFGGDRNAEYRNMWRGYLDLGIRSRLEGWSFEEARGRMEQADRNPGSFVREMLATFHPGFAADALIGEVRMGRCGWCAAEVIRTVGVKLESDGDEAGAAGAYDEARRRAGAEGALFWELRAASSLYALERRRGDADESRVLLGEVLSRLTEGHRTRDVQSALSLLS